MQSDKMKVRLKHSITGKNTMLFFLALGKYDG